nr:MAG TPA: hypothetical protein [Caudoviricetes sp.]
MVGVVEVSMPIWWHRRGGSASLRVQEPSKPIWGLGASQGHLRHKSHAGG